MGIPCSRDLGTRGDCAIGKQGGDQPGRQSHAEAGACCLLERVLGEKPKEVGLEA